MIQSAFLITVVVIAASLGEMMDSWRCVCSGAHMAGDKMARPRLGHGRDFSAAARFGQWAAGMEMAARWRPNRARHFASKNLCATTSGGIGQRHRIEQGLGIGMQRRTEER